LWARFRKLNNALDESLQKKIGEQNDLFLKNVVVVAGRHTLETSTSNIWCMCGDVFPFNKLGAELVNSAVVAPLDRRADIITQIEKNFADHILVILQQYGGLPRIRLPTKFLKVLTLRIGTSLVVPNGMNHALNAEELDIIKRFAIETLDEVKSKSCHLD